MTESGEARWERLFLPLTSLSAAISIYLRMHGISQVGFEDSDALAYYQGALRWFTTGHLDSAFVMFGKPAASLLHLAGFRLFGTNPMSFIYMNALLGTLSILALSAIGYLLGGWPISFLVTTLYGLNPYALFLIRYPLPHSNTNSLYLILTLTGCLTLRAQTPLPQLALPALAGVLTQCVFLSHGTAIKILLPTIACFGLCVSISGQSYARKNWAAAAFCLGNAAILLAADAVYRPLAHGKNIIAALTMHNSGADAPFHETPLVFLTKIWGVGEKSDSPVFFSPVPADHLFSFASWLLPGIIATALLMGGYRIHHWRRERRASARLDGLLFFFAFVTLALYASPVIYDLALKRFEFTSFFALLAMIVFVVKSTGRYQYAVILVLVAIYTAGAVRPVHAVLNRAEEPATRISRFLDQQGTEAIYYSGYPGGAFRIHPHLYVQAEHFPLDAEILNSAPALPRSSALVIDLNAGTHEAIQNLVFRHQLAFIAAPSGPTFFSGEFSGYYYLYDLSRIFSQNPDFFVSPSRWVDFFESNGIVARDAPLFRMGPVPSLPDTFLDIQDLTVQGAPEENLQGLSRAQITIVNRKYLTAQLREMRLVLDHYDQLFAFFAEYSSLRHRMGLIDDLFAPRDSLYGSYQDIYRPQLEAVHAIRSACAPAIAFCDDFLVRVQALPTALARLGALPRMPNDCLDCPLSQVFSLQPWILVGRDRMLGYIKLAGLIQDGAAFTTIGKLGPYTIFKRRP